MGHWNVDDGEGWHWTMISTAPSKDGDAGYPAPCHHRRESLTLLNSTVLNTHQDPSEVQVLEIEGFLSLPCLPAGPSPSSSWASDPPAHLFQEQSLAGELSGPDKGQTSRVNNPSTSVHGKLFPVSPSASYRDLRLQLSSCHFRGYALTSSGPPITLIDNHLLIPKTVLDLFRPYLAIKSGHHTGTRTSLCIGLSKSYPLLPDPGSGSNEL